MTYHITTPIYYVNAAPHLGHAYTTIAADVLHRLHGGRETGVVGQVSVSSKTNQFTTGTDENSLKNVEAAKRVNKPIQQYVDELSLVWQQTWDKLGIQYTSFIRTSGDTHKRAVYKLWKAVDARGDIYKGTYVGQYCIGCEAYVNETDLVDGKCPHHLTTPQQLEEENYFFRASRYKQQILNYIAQNPDFISPKSRRNETINFIKNGFGDISISRQNLEWGIPVPGDPEQVIYVWFDALINYISAVGYEFDEDYFKKKWPANLHLVGKDIIKFHCALWPAILLSAGLELPKKIFAHGFFTVDGQKISKSLGNSIDPLAIADKYGRDALRYYLLAKIPFGSDGDFSFQELDAAYNADLANVLGNLVSRLTNMVEKYLDGQVDIDERIPDGICWVVNQALGELRFKDAVDEVWSGLRNLNKAIEEEKPWVLAKEERTDKLRGFLTSQVNVVLYLTRLIAPIIPDTAAAIEKVLLADNITKCPPLFPRLEK